MTEPVIPAAGATAPVATDTSTQTPPAPGSTPDVGEPKWLPERIAQAKKNAEADARAAVLKELGVDSIDVAKARVAAAAKMEEDAKSELQKRDDRIKELEKTASRVAPLELAITARAASELALLTDTQRAMVASLAGDDAAKQLATIEHLRTGGALAPAKPTMPVGANTSSAQGSPPPASAAPANALVTFEKLQESNPMAAARFYERNAAAIEKARTQ